jgi:hypothetical protein
MATKKSQTQHKKDGCNRRDEEAQRSFETLLYQLLETEQGGVKVYRTAIECVENVELREEFENYLEETERHVEIARDLLESFNLDPDADVPGRLVVRHIGDALVATMEKARAAGDPAMAQLTACECVVHAETKDHLNWELVGLLAENSSGDTAQALREAFEEVEHDEDHHLYHTTGWTRELWAEAMGLPAVLPPPEEEKNVETAIGAARAKQARDEML